MISLQRCFKIIGGKHVINIRDRLCLRKIIEREDELFIVGNILKSLEVSEEKVKDRSWTL